MASTPEELGQRAVAGAPHVIVEFPADCPDAQVEAFKEAWSARDGGPVEYRRRKRGCDD